MEGAGEMAGVKDRRVGRAPIRMVAKALVQRGQEEGFKRSASADQAQYILKYSVVREW